MRVPPHCARGTPRSPTREPRTAAPLDLNHTFLSKMATAGLDAYLRKLQARIAACEAKLGIAAAGEGPEEDVEEVGPTPQELEFDELLAQHLEPFVAAAQNVLPALVSAARNSL